jgi:cytochrome c oxidase assembly protein subunit 15
MENRSHLSIVIWLLSGCVLIASMVVIGGITRLTGSGLSITEWNLLLGTFPPVSDTAWLDVFHKYQQSPQFLKINSSMSLPEFKAIFWWEYLHRLLGRLIGLVFLIPFLYFLVKGRFRDKLLINKLIVLFLLGGFQGFLGWFMVKSGLQNNPHVSHYRLAAHLITAFSVYGFTFWFVLDLLFPGKIYLHGPSSIRKIKQLASVFFTVLIVQILYGAFVAGLKAGSIYNTLPKMGDRWIPEGLSSFHPAWLNFFENLTTIQFIHRSTAVVLVLLCSGILYYANKQAPRPVQKAVWLLTASLFLQFVLGVFTLLYSAPLVLAALHQACALLLFTTALFLNHLLKKYQNHES